MHTFGMLFFWITLLLFLVALAYVFNRFSWFTNHDHDTAQDILDKKYAEGTIDKEEYESKSKAINKHKGSQDE